MSDYFSNGIYSSTQRTAGCYYCIWRSLLIPSKQLLAVELKMTNSRSITVGNLLSQLSDPQVCSFGFSKRFGDGAAKSASLQFPHRLPDCFLNLTRTLCGAGRARVLAFVSNSVRANAEAGARFAGAFDEVLASAEEAPETHINAKAFDGQYADVGPVVSRAMELAAADWFTMTAVGTLLVCKGSGFSSSAALYSRGHQALIDSKTCGWLHPDHLVVSRFN